MKCNALIYKELREKKYPKWKTLELISQSLLRRGFVPRQTLEKYTVCDGEIKATVKIDDDSECYCMEECYCRGNPYIVITYKCNKCGCQDYPELPTQLNDIVTNNLNGLNRTELLDNYSDLVAENENRRTNSR